MTDNNRPPEPVKEKYPPFVALVVETLKQLGTVTVVTALESQPAKEVEE